MSNFHLEREKLAIKRTEGLLCNLPGFCRMFFLGITQTTSPLTRLNYAHDLEQFFWFIVHETDVLQGRKMAELELSDLDLITAFHIELFIHSLATGQDGLNRNGEKGVMRKLACLRSMYNYFYKKDEIKNNAPSKVSMPKLHEKPIVRLDKAEILDLVDTVSTGESLSQGQRKFFAANSLRDTTIIIFFLTTGIRISELVGLNVGDINLTNSSFKITRKGGNQAILYMPEELCQQLQMYFGGIETAGDSALKYDDSPLFLSLRRKRISVRAVQELIGKYAKIAVPLKNISPHKLRSTFGTNLYRSTKDIYVVADVLGHKDVNTTKKHYAALGEDVRREAAKKVKLFR